MIISRQFAIVLGIFLGIASAVAEDARWDDAALDGAGIPPYTHEPVPAFLGDTAQQLPKPVLTIPFPDSDQFLVLGREGQVWSIPRDYDAKDPSHLAANLRATFDEKPLDPIGKAKSQTIILGGVFDREWPQRPYLYLVCNLRTEPESQNYLLRYHVEQAQPLTLATEPEVLLRWESNGHNGSDLHWGPTDGYLYVSAGDGSAPGDPNHVGQHVHQIRGSILRLDVHSQPAEGEALTIPTDNPFVGMPDVRPEIWAYGMRNPWRMIFHPTTHGLWVADNGDEHWEMLHETKAGSNAGWSTYEGSHAFRPTSPLGGPTQVHTPPRLEHSHSEMRSIIGGFFYRGEKLPELTGQYLYGCYLTQEMWAVSYDAESDQLGKPYRLAKLSGPVVSICEDHDREPIITHHDGTFERLQARPAAQLEPREWPERLSATGLFSDVASHTPAHGVHEYLVNAEGWADGATRRRFVAVPDTHPLVNHGGVRQTKSLWLDPGGALVQTLFLEGQPIETQLLYNAGTWRGYTYRWAADGSDATLVPAEGLTQTEPHAWRYPSRSECMICHTQKSMFGIAFTARQLDRIGVDGETNQLDRWIEEGILRNSSMLKTERAKACPDPYDADSGTLAQRARTYLDVNCAHCHREAGLGGRASFQLMADLTLEETGLIDADPMVAMLGLPDAKVIAPGHPDLSELLGRVSRRGAGQMPLLGSQVVDEAGVALLKQWIESMAEPSESE